MTLADAITSIASDPTQALLGAGGGVALITGVVTLARAAIRLRKHARNNAAQEHMADAGVEVARLEAEAEDVRQVPGLIEKIDTLWREKDECKEALRKESAARTRAEEDCKRQIGEAVESATAPLREQLVTVARMTRRSLPNEITGVQHLDDIIAGHTPLPRAIPTVSDRRDMEPHGGEE